jgi:hypothetical protein
VLLITLLSLPFDPRGLVRPWALVLLPAMACIGGGLPWLARALGRGAGWARILSFAALLLMAFGAGTYAAWSVNAPSPHQQDGPAYAFLSMVTIGAGCLVGPASLLRRPPH